MAADSGPRNASPFTPVRRVSPTQQVREQLVAAIEQGDYPPGAGLPSERELCQTLGVSRVSVRAAIAWLEARGLIIVQHGRGAFVRDQINDPFRKYLKLHRADVLELLKVRGALDTLASGEAAQNATAAQQELIVAADEAFRAAAAQGETVSRARLAALDVAFHQGIAMAAGGTLLISLLRELNTMLDTSRQMTLAREGQPMRSAKQHRAIVGAILKRDCSAARRLTHAHVSGVRSWVEGLQESDFAVQSEA